MRNALFISLCLLWLPVQAVEYSILVPQQSSVTFVSTQMGVPVEGIFKTFSTAIAIDPDHPEQGTARIEVELASVDTGSQEADEEVVKPIWFDAAAHPVASFVSTTVKPLGQGRYAALGKLTIKGKTLVTQATFSIEKKAGLLTLPGSFTLKRLDYAIGSGIWSDTSAVADEVEVHFRISLTR
ncbi:MAG: YceI family protein [Sideroxyarcus sp.]|nr:YceI family protein [Sideroxyarcus sp.]